jgi:hypothetical protein
MKNVLYEHKLNRRGELRNPIFDAARRMNLEFHGESRPYSILTNKEAVTNIPEAGVKMPRFLFYIFTLIALTLFILPSRSV